MLRAEHLTKHFGSVCAVDDVSFDLEAGKILGLIGRNGSGKTTIFRLLLGFLTSEGQSSVLWKGQPLKGQVYNVIGYLPEERGLYEKMTIAEQITYFAELRGLSRAEIEKRLPIWLERFEVKGKPDDKISKLSKGNQQKVQVIGTIIHEPEFVILDEPFSGLDPVNADLLRQGILHLRDQGSSIIFSSHNMANVEAICDDLLMIHDGEALLQGGVQEVRNRYPKTTLWLEKPGLKQDDLAALEGVTTVEETTPGRFQLKLANEEVGHQIFDWVTRDGYIQLFSQQPPTLESIFKEEVRKAHE